MKYIMFILAMVATHPFAYSQEEQLLLLNSRKVKEYVYITVQDKDDKLGMEYKIDNLKHTKDFDKTLYISSRLNNDQVIIYTQFINPLKYTVSFNDTIEADPSLQNLSKLLDAVGTMAQTLNPSSSAVTASTAAVMAGLNEKTSAVMKNVVYEKVIGEYHMPPATKRVEVEEKVTKKMIEELLESKVPVLADWKYVYISNTDNLASLSLKHSLISSIKETSKVFYQEDEDLDNFQKEFTSKVNALCGAEEYIEFVAAKKTMQEFIIEWQDKKFETHRDLIKKLKGNIEATSELEENKNGFIHYTFVTLGNYLKELETIQKQREEIVAEMNKVINEINKIEFVTASNEPDNVYGMIKHKVNISDENIKLVTISVKKRVLKFESNKFTYKDGPSVSQKIKLRSHSNFVIEASAGIYFSNIKYPVYGTEEVGGVTKLKQAEDDYVRLVPATAVNLVFNGMNSWIHPMAQIGVGAGKDRPLLLTGIGARFFKPRNAAVAFGYAWPWIKQLDKLKVGDTITGTVDIENDTKYSLSKKPEFYIGIQIDFK